MIFWRSDSLVADIAKLTSKWRDENKFTFIWKGSLVLVYYDDERKIYKILSVLDPEDEKDVYYWLYNGTIKPEKEEEEEKDK